MAKPVIAVDMDDVLLPHFQDLADWYNKTFGTTLTLADNHPKGTDVSKWGTKSVPEAVRRVHGFYDTPEFLQAQPYAEAKTVLRALSERYRLVIITARDTIIEKVTRDWLEQHFADFFEAIHFTAQYSLEGKNRSKAVVCHEIQAEYLIDDDIKNLLDAREVGVKGVLFADYPWSKTDELPEGITRCLDWPAVLTYFESEVGDE